MFSMMFPATLPGPSLTLPDAIPQIALAMAPDLSAIAQIAGLVVVAAAVAAAVGSSVGEVWRRRRHPVAPASVTRAIDASTLRQAQGSA